MASFQSFLLPMPMLLFLTTLLFVNYKVVNSAESLAFSFTKFLPDQQDLIFQGDALVTSTGNLQLNLVKNGNPVINRTGRALYSAPVQIWDRATGNVASFISAFSFIINSPYGNADGFAFFLAPVNTHELSYDGLLGVFPDRYQHASNQIVAVEFDTYTNEWDPQGTHIGIDVNGVNSVKTTPWALENGQVAHAIIAYQASTKVLTASLTYPKSTQNSFIISAVVDIKNVLPEYVRVGFSATSGQTPDRVESDDVLAWSFQTQFPTGTINDVAAFINGLDVSA